MRKQPPLIPEEAGGKGSDALLKLSPIHIGVGIDHLPVSDPCLGDLVHAER